MQTEKITVDDDGAEEAPCQRDWDKDINDRTMAPSQAAAGLARGGGGDAVGGRCRGASASKYGDVAPNAMVVAASPAGGGTQGGGRVLGPFGA